MADATQKGQAANAPMNYTWLLPPEPSPWICVMLKLYMQHKLVILGPIDFLIKFVGHQIKQTQALAGWGHCVVF